VPITPAGYRSSTSNQIYADTVEKMLNISAEEPERPASDYTYLPDDYPVRWNVPDFGAQVDEFLSMKQPLRVPSETLWIFSFGTWDIWDLAAMPQGVASSAMDSIIADLFLNIERLYEASLDPSSIAFSDYFSDDQDPGNAGDSSDSGGLTARSGITAMGSRDPDVEPFTIIIPQLFDPTLIPGWQARPPLGKVHSKAEQMRNAVRLTNDWNWRVRTALEIWVKMDPGAYLQAGEDEEHEEGLGPVVTKSMAGGLGPTATPTEGWKDPSPTMEPVPSATEGWTDPNPTFVSDSQMRYPQRDCINFDMPKYLLDVIIDRQLRSQDTKDANGYGELPTEHGFMEVTTPCVNDPELFTRISDDEEDDDMTIGEANGDGTQADIDSLEIERRGVHFQRRDKNNLTVAENQMEQAPNKSRKVPNKKSPPAGLGSEERRTCEAPHEHLFYSEFTLGQRAIDEIARQAAYAVRRNDSMRAFWDGIGKESIGDPRVVKEGPGSWIARY